MTSLNDRIPDRMLEPPRPQDAHRIEAAIHHAADTLDNAIDHALHLAELCADNRNHIRSGHVDHHTRNQLTQAIDAWATAWDEHRDAARDRDNLIGE